MLKLPTHSSFRDLFLNKKTEGEIKNGQSRDTGNKTQDENTQDNKKKSNTDLTNI